MKMVSIPEEELERLKEKNRQQARQLRIMQEAAEARNLDLDAMHFVWCDGSCPSGVHRFTPDAILTEEMLERAERNTRRLREWYEGVKWRMSDDYRSMSEWHKKYAERAASRTDLTE